MQNSSMRPLVRSAGSVSSPGQQNGEAEQEAHSASEQVRSGDAAGLIHARFGSYSKRATTQRPPQRSPDGLTRLYAAKRGSRPLIGVTGGVFQSVPQCRRRRSR